MAQLTGQVVDVDGGVLQLKDGDTVVLEYTPQQVLGLIAAESGTPEERHAKVMIAITNQICSTFSFSYDYVFVDFDPATGKVTAFETGDTAEELRAG